MALVLGELSVLLTANTARFQRALDGASRKLQGIGTAMRGIGLASGAAGLALGGLGAKLVKAASDANETASFMKVAFGQGAAAVEQWARKTGAAMNRSQFQMREFATTLQAMLAGMVGSKDAAAEMSMRMAELAVDIGSARNISDELALEKLRAGLAGEMEPLRQLGVVMSVANLEAFALSQGIQKSYQSMEEAEKVALRYKFILANTSLDQGDATRTAGSLANRLKGLQGRFRDIAVELGQKLVPVAEDLVSKFSGIMDWFDRLDSGSKTLILKVGVIATALALLGTALIPLGAAVGALATIAGVLASVVTPGLLVGAVAVAAMVGAFGALRLAWKEFEDPIRSGLQWILDRFDDFLDRIDDTIQKLVDLGGKVATAFKSGSIKEIAKALASFAVVAVDPLQIGTPQAQIPEGRSNEDRLADVGDVLKDSLKRVFDTIGKEFVGGALKEAFLSGIQGIADLVPPELKEKLAEWQEKLKGLINEITKVTNKVGAGESGQGAVVGTSLMLGAAMAVAAKAAKTLSERLNDAWKAAKKFFDGLPNAAKGALSVLGSALNQGEVATVVQGATQGGEAGGPVGAVIGALVALATTTEAFQTLLTEVNGVLKVVAGILGQVLGPVVTALQPIFHGIRAALAPLVPLLVVLAPIFQLLANAAQAVGFVLRGVFEAFRFIAVGILKAVRFVLKAIGRSTKKVDNALDDLQDMSFDTAGEIEDLGDAAEKAAAALINVPEGFKIAAYRWAADMGTVPPWMLPAAPGVGATLTGTYNAATSGGTSGATASAATSAGGGNVVYIENLVALDPEQALDELDRAARRRNYLRRGNPNPTPPGFFGR